MVFTACILAASMAKDNIYSQRARDWSIGPVVYQVFVDRFAESSMLDIKRNLYAAPRRLKSWNEEPVAGVYDPSVGAWTHELDFWGGDISSLRSRLTYIQELGADVLYTLPLHEAKTNHKYDATNYLKISPDYGTEADFDGLVKDVHSRGMKIMLDGVFNHMGKSSPLFQSALKGPKAPYRDWFMFGDQFGGGYRGWAGAGNLPALRLENPKVSDFLWEKPDSVVQSFLKRGVDGWRLDVAFELGRPILTKITKAAKRARKDAVVIGEIGGYPADWAPSVDGVFNYFAMNVAKLSATGMIPGGQAGQMWQDMVNDGGTDTILRSWLVTDNHDSARLASEMPSQPERHLVQFLQMTLPGAPVIYYGTELGMKGKGDPDNRGPMRWDLVTEGNPDLAWMRKLIAIRKKTPALRMGDFTALRTTRLIAFQRTTDRLDQMVVVAANPTNETIREHFPVRVGQLMSWGILRDVLNGGGETRVITGLMNLEMKPKTCRIYVFDKMVQGGTSPYDRSG